ncbi:unnamed protein product [Closterium sp. Yama58-4]|nr:unnamed protein product [Closterium sp. Yama58-4]
MAWSCCWSANSLSSKLQQRHEERCVFFGYWLFPLAEKNITESTCPLTSYEDVGSVVSYRSLSATCNNAKCSNPSTQASTSACGQSILEAAIMLTENDSQISDCYYVVTMRLAQAHFKSVYKSVFFLCDAVPPLANASINLTAISSPPPVAAPPVEGPDASAPSPSAKPSSPAPAPAPSLVAPSSTPAPAPSAKANSTRHAPSSAPSPAPAGSTSPASAPSPAPSSSISPASAPSPSPTNKTIGVPGSLNEPQEPSGSNTGSVAKTKGASSGTGSAFSGFIVVLKRASFELQQFLEQEKQKAMLNELVAKLTEVCWDKCVTAAPGTKFSGSESSCLSNCAQRYLDVSGLIVRKFQGMQR